MYRHVYCHYFTFHSFNKKQFVALWQVIWPLRQGVYLDLQGRCFKMPEVVTSLILDEILDNLWTNKLVKMEWTICGLDNSPKANLVNITFGVIIYFKILIQTFWRVDLSTNSPVHKLSSLQVDQSVTWLTAMYWGVMVTWFVVQIQILVIRELQTANWQTGKLQSAKYKLSVRTVRK